MVCGLRNFLNQFCIFRIDLFLDSCSIRLRFGECEGVRGLLVVIGVRAVFLVTKAKNWFHTGNQVPTQSVHHATELFRITKGRGEIGRVVANADQAMSRARSKTSRVQFA